MAIGLGLLAGLPAPVFSQGPVINVWYGESQRFGHMGSTQRWVNVLGNVSDPQGISSLVYSLNGGPPVSLSVGPDARRLVSSGDFNIDLATANLIDGSNQIIMTATDGAFPANITVDTVTVDYTSGTAWTMPDTVEWGGVSAIEDVAQVVDGLWAIQPDGTLRTTIPGYDRLVAIGDTLWTDYEVTVPVKFHTMPSGFGAGVLFRWKGHTDDPVPGRQPKSGWNPLGCILWARSNKLELYGNNSDIIGSVSKPFTTGVTYVLKARVETIQGIGGRYSLKAWVEGQPEPAGWDVTGQETLSDPQSGSMMLISHLADVRFGRVLVTPLPVTLGNIAVTTGPGGTTATVSWTTSQPATSSVAYGLTTSYELGTISDPALVTNHSVTLTGLEPNTLYHYLVSSVDGLGNSADSGDRTFSTMASILVSDDFSSSVLDTSLWTFVDPLGDGSYALSGSHTADAWVNISVPAGVEHEVWTSGIRAPHLLQAANDVDFEVEVKFESMMPLQYQEEGIVVKQDAGNYLRFDFYSTSSTTRVYARGFTPATSLVYNNAVIGANNLAPLYLRVKREGNQWTQSYSMDGTNWTDMPAFTHALSVSALGLYCGNGLGVTSPAYTLSIDYFFNTASPIDPEDPPAEPIDVTVTPHYDLTNCETPVDYTFHIEAGVNEVRSYGLTFSVDSAVVTISDPTPAGHFTEGTFLSDVGGTSFTVADEGGGVYTVNCAILGGTVGATGGGDLFTVTLTPVGEGTSAIAITSIEVLDPGNVPFDVVGVDGEVQVDCTAPLMQAIVEPENNVYDVAPSFSVFAFRDSIGLDLADYQIDASGWFSIFSALSFPDTVWTGPGWELPGFAALDDGWHTVYFRVKDDAGNWDGMGYSWSFMKDLLAAADGEVPYIPAKTALLQNYPNPFNPTTAIAYDVATAGQVRIEIYDVTGALVRTLVNEEKGVGRYTATWDGRDGRGGQVHTGVYFYRMTAPAYRSPARKMLLLK